MDLLLEIVSVEICVYLKNIHILNLISTCKYYWMCNNFMLGKVTISYDKLLIMCSKTKERIRSLTITNDTNGTNMNFINVRDLPQNLTYLRMNKNIFFNTYQKLPISIKILKMPAAFQRYVENSVFIPDKVESIEINIGTDLSILSSMLNIKKLILIKTGAKLMDNIKCIPSSITYIKYIYENTTEVPYNINILLNNLKQSVTKLYISVVVSNFKYNIPSHIKILKIYKCSVSVIIPDFVDEIYIDDICISSYSLLNPKISISKKIKKIIIKNYEGKKLSLSDINNYICWY